MTIDQYIKNINQRYNLGNATEHTFRGDLQQLIESLVPTIRATNEPKRQSCGAPDYILTKKDIPVGFIEAKHIGDNDLDGKKRTGNKEQFDRYKTSLNNLIFTDYIDFHLYNDGELITKISIAEITDKGIVAIPQNFIAFENIIKDFCTHVGQTIKSPKKLAEMMAGKARLLSDVIGKALTSDDTHNEDSTLKQQMEAFKHILIHDITPKGFADVYAQTIAYGMFAARLHDPTLNTFSRQEAAELIPKSNPFLRNLFSYIAGPDIDDRIKWIVDNLTEIFLACNVEQILKNYGKATKMEDPIIHFYETFLSEYDPKLRKARGVWYTPAPVVNFIVRAVDDILKTEFNLKEGLADTSKIKSKVKIPTHDKRKKVDGFKGYTEVEQEVHKVQIIDPATGTGTFLAEVIKHINKKFKGQEGIWSSYVENNLLPRLNGFELLMASYAMAHLQLDLLLKETGFKPTKNQRTRVYLTNSLEEYHPETGTLFANWLSSEANEANQIKRDTPVMCVIGNPPYAVSSTNKGDWIQNLLVDYKKNLNERKINLDDDYIKFIRYGQHFINKNGEGILAYISNNSFIDGITHRQMRKNLLETFDKVYILDLHGSAKKNETANDGGRDENVFDIQQGVSINIFIKTGKKKKNELGQVIHSDLLGKRDLKYTHLSENSVSSLKWNLLKNKKPYYFFVPKNFELQEVYQKNFSINNFFLNVNSGIKTDRDKLFIDFSKKTTENKFKSLLSGNIPDSFINEYRVVDSGSYKITEKIKNVNYEDKYIKPILYRPFDVRSVYYDPKIVSRPGTKVAHHILNGSIALVSCRQQSTFDFQHILVSKYLTEVCTVSLQTKETGYVFPLYLYPEKNGQKSIENTSERTPNLKQEIVNKIAQKLSLTFLPEKEIESNVCFANSTEIRNNFKTSFAPIDILDYIYAVLHSPTYRVKYKEFLKIDFPRVPYPKDAPTFWEMVKLGGEIRQIHLLESPKVEDYITSYPKDGNNIITTKIAQKDWEFFNKENQLGRIWINEEQYFDNIPLVAWEFYIGGYQPAQKWLKDRKGRILEFDDILHYQKIIVALTETDRLMTEIDKIEFEK